MRRPSLGLLDCPCPMLSGRMMKVLGGVEELSGSEERAGEVVREEVAARSAGAMKDQHRVPNRAGSVVSRCPDGQIVQAQAGESFTRGEAEIADRKLSSHRIGMGRRLGCQCAVAPEAQHDCQRCQLMAHDTWAFTIIGDRLPIAAIIVLIYFGVVRSHPVLGLTMVVVLVALLKPSAEACPT